MSLEDRSSSRGPSPTSLAVSPSVSPSMFVNFALDVDGFRLSCSFLWSVRWFEHSEEIFTSKVGSTDQFDWFMDYVVGLFTSSLDS